MPSEISRILYLPPEVATQIRSSTAIPSLSTVVLGLLENALDANASNIQINVDCRRGACTVEDNGDGIKPSEFLEDGGLGKPYCTSKHNSSADVYGRYGTFLSSVAALSILTITSQHIELSSSSTLILHHSRPAARLTPAPAHQQLLHGFHGTRVMVQDLFGNMPVRVKQRAADNSVCERADERKLETLCKQVVTLILGWHSPVSVTLSCGGSKSKKLNIRNKELAQKTLTEVPARTFAQNRLGRMTKPIFDMSLVCHILSQAGYVEPFEYGTWIRTSARTHTLDIRGCISLQPAPSKHVQFISLGFRPIYAEIRGNVLYDEVNRLFAASNFGTQDERFDTEEAKRTYDRRFKHDGYTNKQLQGGSKGVDRWPMFYIRIETQNGDDLENLEREGNLANMVEVLGAMIHGFLKDNHCRPRRAMKKSQRDTTRPRVTSRSSPRLDDSFSTWSRIKVGKTSRVVAGYPSAKPPLEKTRPPTNVVSLNPTSQPEFIGPLREESQLAVMNTTIPPDDQQDDMINWVNPISKERLLIDSRTGLVLSSQRRYTQTVTAPSNLQSCALSLPRRVTSRGSSSVTAPKPGSWASNLLDNWENPIFAPTEEAIPQLPPIESNIDHSAANLHRPKHHYADADIQRAFSRPSSSFSTKLSKTALKNATVIAQVDKKFLLICMSTAIGPPNLLVLVDQHAADERIRVEALIYDLTTKPAVILSNPILFELHSREEHLFTTHAAFFAQWGINYTITPSNPNIPNNNNNNNNANGNMFRVNVTALPGGIAEKCRIEPSILISLLRSEAYKVADSPTTPSSQTPLQGLLDMLSSRACRSAVMFNDVLNFQECETLVRRLAETEFPFQCAHGRVSMVPLVDLGGGDAVACGEEEGFGAAGEGGGEGFGDAWKRWRDGSSA